MQEYIHCKNGSTRCQMRGAAIGASQRTAGHLMPRMKSAGSEAEVGNEKPGPGYHQMAARAM